MFKIFFSRAQQNLGVHCPRISPWWLRSWLWIKACAGAHWSFNCWRLKIFCWWSWWDFTTGWVVVIPIYMWCEQAIKEWSHQVICIVACCHSVKLLWLERLSGKCAKLHTVAASNNRDHALRSLYYCLFAPLIYGCCFKCTFHSWWTAHSAQRQRRGCNNIPSFLQRTAPIACSSCEGFTQYDLHILVTAPFCCDWNDRAEGEQSFTLWQQATIEITCRDHSIAACSFHLYVGVVFCTHSVCGEPHIQRRLQQSFAHLPLGLSDRNTTQP